MPATPEKHCRRLESKETQSFLLFEKSSGLDFFGINPIEGGDVVRKIRVRDVSDLNHKNFDWGASRRHSLMSFVVSVPGAPLIEDPPGRVSHTRTDV